MKCPQDGGLDTEPSHFAAKEVKVLGYDGACIRIQVPFRRSLLATSSGQFIPPDEALVTIMPSTPPHSCLQLKSPSGLL